MLSIMKNKQILCIIGIILILCSSCKENILSESEKNVSTAISTIKALGDFRKVEYQFIGNPSDDVNKNSTSTIQLKLHEGRITNTDYESFGKKCAKIILNASEDTKKYSIILVSLVNTKREKKHDIEIKIGYSNEVRNYVFNTSDL